MQWSLAKPVDMVDDAIRGGGRRDPEPRPGRYATFLGRCVEGRVDITVRGGRRVVTALLSVLMLIALVGVPAAAQPAGLVADGSLGNGIAVGEVKDQFAPGRAIVAVRNPRRFWVAIDPVEQWGSMTFDPAPLEGPQANLGGAWATVAVIPPGGTAAYDLSWDPGAGSGQSFRVHYDGTSAGGLAATALNIVQLVGHVVGEGDLGGDAAAVGVAIRTLTQLPEWQDIVRKHQDGALAITDLPAVVKALLGSDTGRKALREALRAVGLKVGLSTLRKIATGVSGAEVLLFLKDLGEAVGDGEVDGSVQFYALAPVASSPDAAAGQWIAFIARLPGAAAQVMVVRPDGSDLHPLTSFADPEVDGSTDHVDFSELEWSPDGTRIAFVGPAPANPSYTAVFVVDLGGQVTKLSTETDDASPWTAHIGWTTDSQWVVAESGGSVTAYSLRGSRRSIDLPGYAGAPCVLVPLGGLVVDRMVVQSQKWDNDSCPGDPNFTPAGAPYSPVQGSWLVDFSSWQATPVDLPSVTSSALAPDGSRLAALVRDDDGVNQVVVFDLENGQRRTLTRNTCSFREGVDCVLPEGLMWSEDGSRVLFGADHLDDTRPRELWAISADGGPKKIRDGIDGLNRLIRADDLSCVMATVPMTCVDGGRLVTVAKDGLKVKDRGAAPDGVHGWWSWSPDRRHLAFTTRLSDKDAGGENYHVISVLDPAAGDESAVTPDLLPPHYSSTNGFWPVWSP